jgi:hypothetical protein
VACGSETMQVDGAAAITGAPAACTAAGVCVDRVGPRESHSVLLDGMGVSAGWNTAVPAIHPCRVMPQLPEMELGVLETGWEPRGVKWVPLEGTSLTE